MTGLAKYVGLSSPVIMTTMLGSVSTIVFIIFVGGFSSLETVRFRYEHTKMINATAMSNNVRARPPKRYGIGDFHTRTPLADDDAMLVAFVLISLFLILQLANLYSSFSFFAYLWCWCNKMRLVVS